MDYLGTIIEESLLDKSVLQRLKILETRVEPVMEKHRTPWLGQWTLHRVEISENLADDVAALISGALDYTHKSAWYADYKNKDYHYIIYKDKIFKIPRDDAKGYRQAKE